MYQRLRKSLWTHPTIVVGDEAQVEARFNSFVGSARHKIGARIVLNIPKAQKSFWTHPMELLGDVGHVESRFDLFGYSLSVGAR
jgi:tRNA G37 N-methylase Trm5